VTLMCCLPQNYTIIAAYVQISRFRVQWQVFRAIWIIRQVPATNCPSV